jgi:hypothetical protein
VWGAVNQPGLWRIEQKTDLVQFLSVVGVPAIGRDEAGVRIKVMISLYRTVQGTRRQVYTRDVEEILAEGAEYPILENGDILEVETIERRSIGLRFVSTLIGTASSLTSLILLLTRSR